MAPSTNGKYFQKGKGKQAYSKKFRPSAEEDAAVKAFFADFPKTDEQPSYEAADHDTPRAKMENPLPPGAKGLAASRFAEEEEEKPLLPPGEKGLANSRFAKDAVEKAQETSTAQPASPSVAASITKAEPTVTKTEPIVTNTMAATNAPVATTTALATSTMPGKPITPTPSTTPTANMVAERVPEDVKPSPETNKPVAKIEPAAIIKPAPTIVETDQSTEMKIAAIRAAEQRLAAAMASRQAAQMMLHASEEAIMIARAQLHQAQENYQQGLPQYEQYDHEQYEEEL